MAYAAAGARVFASARRPETLADLAPLCAGTLQLDVTDPASVHAAVGAVLAQAGRLDVLINNAGIVVTGPTSEVPLPDVWKALETNVLGVVACCHFAVPIMAAQGAGRIINIASLTGFTPVPLRGIYSATKAAVMRLSDALRLELAALGIQVMVAAPGFVESAARGTARDLALSWVGNSASLWPGWMDVLEAAMAKLLINAVPADKFAAALVAAASRPRVPSYWVGPCAGLEWLLRFFPRCLQDRLAAKAMGLQNIRPPAWVGSGERPAAPAAAGAGRGGEQQRPKDS